MGILYFIIALVATVLGALVGLGGGVIIKPTLDFLNDFNIATIGVLSSMTVFSMAVISTINQIKGGFKAKNTLVFIAVGSLAGGVVGRKLFSIFMTKVNDDLKAKGIQAIILAVLMISVLIIKKFNLKSYNVHNSFALFATGFILGATSAFLGIGGGPINVAVLYLLFSMDMRLSAVCSVFIILLAQGGKLTSILITTGFDSYSFEMLPYLLTGGILGGFLGSKLNIGISQTKIRKVFLTAVLLITGLNIYNALNFFNVI